MRRRKSLRSASETWTWGKGRTAAALAPVGCADCVMDPSVVVLSGVLFERAQPIKPSWTAAIVRPALETKPLRSRLSFSDMRVPYLFQPIARSVSASFGTPLVIPVAFLGLAK